MTDVIVCGGGLAGLSAAVTAAEAGASVLLVEKAPQLGGTTVLSGGLLWTFGDFEQLRAKVPDGDPALQWLVFETIDEGRDWLRSVGIKVGEAKQVLSHGSGTDFDPADAVERLARRLESLDGRIMLSTPMHSLLTDEGVVKGIRILREGRLETLPSKSVVLATGGFQGNQELITRYIVRDASNVTLRASPWSTGDGFIAATGIGAAVSPGLDSFYGHALAAAPARYGRAQLREVSQYHGLIAVALNMNGERFSDESEQTGEEAINQRLAQQAGGTGFYITDADALERTPIQGRESITRSILARAQAAGAVVYEAHTLEELCDRMQKVGVPKARALETLKAYNKAILDGAADDLNPPRRSNVYPLAKAPFTAVMVKAGITATMGGIKIDEKARVVWRTGSSTESLAPPDERAFVEADAPEIAIGSEYREATIAGLFAAGSDVGNISHFGYVGGLATALTTGRMAGAQAALFRKAR